MTPALAELGNCLDRFQRDTEATAKQIARIEAGHPPPARSQTYIKPHDSSGSAHLTPFAGNCVVAYAREPERVPANWPITGAALDHIQGNRNEK